MFHGMLTAKYGETMAVSDSRYTEHTGGLGQSEKDRLGMASWGKAEKKAWRNPGTKKEASLPHGHDTIQPTLLRVQGPPQIGTIG